MGLKESNGRGIPNAAQAWFLAGMCAVVLGATLAAGLWPFRAPRNDVSWVSQGSGLVFGKHGTVVSASPLGPVGPPADQSCGLEIWLQSNRSPSSGVVLSFYQPGNKAISFLLRQFQNGLVLDRGDQTSLPNKDSIYVGSVFRDSEPAFVAISSGPAGTVVYVDGKLVRRAPTFVLSSQDLTGQLIVGGRPFTAYSWSGDLKGLAIYYRELVAGDVSQDFAGWTNGNDSNPDKTRGMAARYLFDEREGRVAHNQLDSATNLLIPERFFVFQEKFLEAAWDEFSPGWHYWKDVAINIAGFVPLGFFFYAYLSLIWRRKMKWATWLTIVLGFAVSLTIEVWQAFLPTRDSGMTDLITNTLGTAIGVLLCSKFKFKDDCPTPP
jgi:hypothetical protein